MLGYHLANVALHSTAAVLVVLVLRQLSLPGAFLAGLIFALHPVCVESVAWISEQKNTLSAVFYLASAYVYSGGIQGQALKRVATACTVAQPFKAVWYWLAFALFVLRTPHEDGHRDITCCLASRDVVAARPYRMARCGAHGAVARRRRCCRPAYRLVRTSDHRRTGRGLRADCRRAHASRRSCHLFLSDQVVLARQSHLCLSALDDRRVELVAVPLSVGRSRDSDCARHGCAAHLRAHWAGRYGRQADRFGGQAWAACRLPVLLRNARSGARVLQRISVPVLVCGGSLPIPGEPRHHRARGQRADECCGAVRSRGNGVC